MLRKILLTACLSFFVVVSQLQIRAETPVDYAKEIKPLLKSRCYSCHGALAKKAGLRLDTKALMVAGGDSGNILELPDSLLLERIASEDPDQRMPPQGEGAPLGHQEIALIRRWISAGAPSPTDEKPEPGITDHWAYKPLKRPKVPKSGSPEVRNHAIDAFLSQNQSQKGLKTTAMADRLTRLRRISMDLTGLPPDLTTINRVLSASDESWYEKEVDRLLNLPQHGERWARHWMDIWRYSDWWGLGNQHRNSQKHIWHWRDWIIESLNRDRPYDEIVRLMIAADEIDPENDENLRATGFLARNYFLFNRNQWMDETVEHVGKAFLGLTLNCAKCHDHKYDPIRQTDYYAVRAVFEPYMVRNEILPDQIGDDADALPRAYDARPEDPTYRFIRGAETNPDQSVVIAPDVPQFLLQRGLVINPVNLPLHASQPHLRPHILKSLKKHQAKQIESAKKAWEDAEKNWRETLQHLNAKGQGSGQSDAPAKAVEESAKGLTSLLQRITAEKKLALAELELTSIELRSAADHAVAASTELAGAKIRSAVESERRVALAKAELKLAASDLELVTGDSKKREALQKARDSAESELATARKQIGDLKGKHTPLTGAVHIQTRFLDSTKDDPFAGFPSISTGRRKAFAEWLTDPANPLTARVAVNHIWSRHFGQPLVASVFDFGRNGTPTEHAELLDWLAAELIHSGWRTKHIHRLILMSRAYQRSSSGLGHDRENQTDPDNLQFWRWPGYRLESQAIRDTLLSLGGQLDLQMGGPPVATAQQARSHRRSLYFFHSNNERNAFLTAFDEASVKECYRRDQSIVPQQSLALSNAALVHEMAPAIASQISAKLPDPGDDRAFVNLAFAYLLGMEPSDAERETTLKSLAEWKSSAKSGEAGVKDPRSLLVWVLINHNDFVTLR